MTVDGDEKAVRSRVFMDISIGGLPSGRLVFELFNDIAPKTAENFRALCAGDLGVGKNTGKPLTYKGMLFHRVVKDFMIQGGDFTNANGTGGESIYGGTFEDETFELQHDRPYLLSMANRGKDTNGSQFFITTQPAPHLDNVHVVFGHVIGGATLVRQLEALPVDRNARPLQDVCVTNCGQLVRLSAKKRKQEKEQKAESDAESEHSHKKDKKKKKDKKEKKKKRRHSGSGDEEEEPEAPSHPLVSTTKIDPREIPDVPTNRFLMRGGRDQDDQRTDRRDRERMRYREREHRSYTRSGRVIKGRGVFRYRTPSRSRSRSRSVTPPHWRQAQRRIIKLSEFERAEQEREQQESSKKKEIERQQSREADGGNTPVNAPEEKEEGECDSTIDRSRHEKIDYNALDFEEDIEHDEESSHKRKAADKLDRRRDARRPTPENRADMLAMALGVNPKHDQQRDAAFGRDNRDSVPRRREGLPSAVGYAAPKLSSAIANVSDGLAKGSHDNKAKDDYDPFSLLRSTFNRGEKKDQRKEAERPDRRETVKSRLGEKEKDKDKEDRRDRFRSEKDDRDRKHSEQRNDKDDRGRKPLDAKNEKDERSRKPLDTKEDRLRKLSEMSEPRNDKERQRKNSEQKYDKDDDNKKERDRKNSERNEKDDRVRKHSEQRSEREDRDRKHSDYKRNDKQRRERSEQRDKSKERGNEKSRDNDRSKTRDDDKDKKRRRSRTPSPAKQRSKSRDRKQSVTETREKSGERTPVDDDKKKQEDERNEARKELMEIVRLIKSRQRDRENKQAAVQAKKKRETSESDSSESDHEKRRRRSSDRDRRRRSSSRGRHSSSERRSRRRRSRSPRRDRRDRRRSSSSR